MHTAKRQLLLLPFFVLWCAALGTPFLLLPVGLIFFLHHHYLSYSIFALSYGVAFLLSVYGIYVRRIWFQLKSYPLHIAGLPQAFHEYKIVHLSDLHIGTATPKKMAMRWIRCANKQEADLVVITGDVVSNGTHFHQDIADLLGELRAKDGVILTMGNHDYFGSGEPLIQLVKDKGVSVFRNEHFVVQREGSELCIASVDDTWTRRASLKEALEGWINPIDLKLRSTTVLLSHDPALFPEAASKGVSLVLSGHTHGGQIAVPFLGRHLSLSHLAHRYHLGFYKKGDTLLYVNPGLGTTGPPIRLGTVPTVAVLVLRSPSTFQAPPV